MYDIIIFAAILFGLFVFTAFFVAADYAIAVTRPTALATYIEKNHKKSRSTQYALEITKNVSNYLSTTQIGITIGSVSIGWVGERLVESFLVYFEYLDSFTPIHTVTLMSTFSLFTLIVIEVIITEILPKNAVLEHPVSALIIIASLIYLLNRLIKPIVWTLEKLAEPIFKIFHNTPITTNAQDFDELEILNLTDQVSARGNMPVENHLFVKRAFAFSKKTATSIMIPRNSLTVFDQNTTAQDALAKYLATHFTRFPVVADHNKDHIIGYVYHFDVVRHAQIDPNLPVYKFMRHISSIAADQTLLTVYQKMQSTNSPLLVVTDEFGGTAGLITNNQIYEQLFSWIATEPDVNYAQQVTKLGMDEAGHMHYTIHGEMPVHKFELAFNTSFINCTELSMSELLLNHVPPLTVATPVTINQFTFTPLKMTDSFIESVEVSFLETPHASD
ncbi:MAG: CNNM domain-containing protein [Lactobacillaceae bacterium]|jgi:CBS domain containing-hemolysin-like protein|nr:CNNM domain-containing protein [Lactobacillaceae bacterium]